MTLTATRCNPQDYIDREMVEDIGFFWGKVLEAFDYRAGLKDDFEAVPGLDWDTEYFGPNVTMDERLRYVGTNLASNPDISEANRVLNVLITHFYGGLEIHRVLNAEPDPKKAFTDFERIAAGDRGYVEEIRRNLEAAQGLGYKPWSANELHTSIQGAAHKYVDSQGWSRHTSAVTEWLASWVTDGTTDRILECQTLEECVKVLTSKRGIGPYYGYHGATDQSTNPALPFHHDEAFVLAGPGATQTVVNLFPGLSKKDMHPNDRVIWVRENQEELFPNLSFNEHWHNIDNDGTPTYSFAQDKLFYYTAEVALCQYGVYCRLRGDAKLAARRKIRRFDVDGLLEQMRVPVE